MHLPNRMKSTSRQKKNNANSEDSRLEIINAGISNESRTTFSISGKSRAGRLAEVIHILAGGRHKYPRPFLADTSDFGILRIIVSDQEKAKTLLKNSGFYPWLHYGCGR